MYKTPLKDPTSSDVDNKDEVAVISNLFKSLDVCSVCLSPCQPLQQSHETSSSCADSCISHKVSVETRCKHHFHEKCLNEAKAMKPECPMCRCPLSPLTDLQAVQHPNLMRQAVVHAATRGRNAVRAAMLRRQLEQQQSQGQEIAVN